jgi:dihydrofolate synthase / folylpolyglutamate synthase
VRFAEALADLDGRQPDRMVPDLERITRLTQLLDEPQRTYPTIHVTGTNGKTTTARIITELACAHGLVTGLYTSPHLLSVTERMLVCDAQMTEGEFAREYEHLLPFLDVVDGGGGERVTYFEVLTALAYLWFADKPVQLGVIEVGMGGVWDATNVIDAQVAVLGEVGFDHPELGSTLREVATEKAGIVKPAAVAVSREQDGEAQEVIERRCREVGATLLLEYRDFELEERLRAVGGQSLSVRGARATYDELFLPLFGEYAAHNAAVAIVAFEAFLDQALEPDVVREGLARATSPGRLEVAGRRPLLVLDGAHNPAGAEALAMAMREFFDWERLHLVLSISSNKDVEGIARVLAPLADRGYTAANASPRTSDPDDVALALAAHELPTEAFATVAEALESARASAGSGDAILATGSLYTVADARRAIGT